MYIKSSLFAFLLLVCVIMIRVDCSHNCTRGTYNATTNSCICPAYFYGNTCALLHPTYCNSTNSASSQACNIINVNCLLRSLCIDTFSDLPCQNCTGCLNNTFHDQYTCQYCSLQCLRGTLDNNTCTCVCPPNFYGDRCENINSTNCDANFTRSFACENNSTCLNGGICDDYFDNLECSNCSSCANVTFEEQYKCNCTEYFNGTDCENCTLTCDRGMLDLTPCQCVCPGKSTGSMCEICSLECLRGTFDNNTCTCDCPPNFYGYSCEYYNVTNCDAFTNSDACNSSSVSCQNGGNCTDLFSDLDCNNCSSCANVPFAEQYKCNCLEYFNGTYCENCTLTCDRGMLNSSTCQCVCPGNSTGSMCETCSLLQCLRGTFNDNECTCNCPPNFYGYSCEYYNSTHCDSSNTTDACTSSSSVSCQNGGTCTDLFSDLDCKNCTSCSEVPFEEQYKCNCLENFNGTYCENCKLTCDRGMLNSSTCQCVCPGNSTGSICETCSLLQCLRGTFDDNKCTCSCPPNFYGYSCEYYNSTHCDSSNTTDACSSSSVSCLNGGNCTDLFSDLDCNNCSSCLGIPFNQQYECDCPESYSGEMCQTCSLNCTRGILKAITCKCECPGNSTGVLCQSCDLQCMGGWINDSSCTCSCNSRYSGYECEIFTPDQCNNNTNRSLVCESPICSNGGNCIDSYSMLDCNTCSNCSNSSLSQLYKCNCLDGYIGDRCDIFDSCDSNPCTNGGNCTNLIGFANYSCTCLDGYSGDTCDSVTVPQTSNTGAIVGAIVGVIVFLISLVVSTLVLFIMAYILIKKQKKGKVTISPNNDIDDEDTEKTPLE